MIKEFSVHPKPRNKKAKLICLSEFAVAAALFITYSRVDRYRGIIGLFAIGFITAAILLYTKYISPNYYYDITFDSNEIPIFVVRQITGKRQTTLCRIDLADIVEITYESAKERKSHKRDNSAKLYVYTPTLFPPDNYRITAKNRYDSFELVVECTEDFAKLLSEYSEEARILCDSIEE